MYRYLQFKLIIMKKRTNYAIVTVYMVESTHAAIIMCIKDFGKLLAYHEILKMDVIEKAKGLCYEVNILCAGFSIKKSLVKLQKTGVVITNTGHEVNFKEKTVFYLASNVTPKDSPINGSFETENLSNQ